MIVEIVAVAQKPLHFETVFGLNECFNWQVVIQFN